MFECSTLRDLACGVSTLHDCCLAGVIGLSLTLEAYRQETMLTRMTAVLVHRSSRTVYTSPRAELVSLSLYI